MTIDLDARRAVRAARREGQSESVIVRFGGQDFTLPAELPASVLDPLIDGDLDLAGLLAVAVQSSRTAKDDAATELVLETLLTHPDLPTGVLRTVRATLATLFGPEQWAAFQGLHPTLPDLAALIGLLVREYGVGLGESLRSANSSPNGGPILNQTSNGSAPQTSVASGPPPATPTG